MLFGDLSISVLKGHLSTCFEKVADSHSVVALESFEKEVRSRTVVLVDASEEDLVEPS